jgi:hypothetical protein
LKDTILKVKKGFDEIISFPFFDEGNLDNCAYCRQCLLQMVDKIGLPQIFDAPLACLEAEFPEARRTVDRNLLEVFESRMPPAVRELLQHNELISEKAKIVREFLKSNPAYFSRENCVEVVNTLIVNKLTCIPQELIECFPNLRDLLLWGNKIEVIPREIGNLRNLRELNLSSNKIKVIPGEIGNLRNLRELDLSSNKIKVIPREIGNLSNLEMLLLPRNRIQDIPTAIGKLGNLRNLCLNENKIQGIPKTIGKLGNLRFLCLDENKIQGIPEEIGNLGNLRELVLPRNRISVIPAAIGKLGDLVWLDLADNPIKTIPGFLSSFQGKFRIDSISAPAASAITDGVSTSSAPFAGPVDRPQVDRLLVAQRDQAHCLNTSVVVGVLAVGTFLLLRMLNAELI